MCERKLFVRCLSGWVYSPALNNLILSNKKVSANLFYFIFVEIHSNLKTIMKKIISLALIILSALNSFGQLPNYVPTSGLFAWLPFTNNASDVSGNSNNGFINGATPTSDRFSAANSSYQFNGSQTIDIHTPFDFNERTISVWFNVSQSNNNIRTIIGNDNPFLNYGHSILTVMEDDTLQTEMGGARCRIDKPTINQWQHIVITRNSSTTKFYSNGMLTCVASNSNIASNNALSYYFRIGGARNNNYYFYGKIDDVGLWTRALSECEIHDLYSAQINSFANTVSINNMTMTSDISGATYQWVNCANNTSISGATNQTYTPATSGNYSVIVNVNGCVDTSNCYSIGFIGIDELNDTDKKILVKIVDVTGREIPYQRNTPLFFVYSNGTVEKKFILE